MRPSRLLILLAVFLLAFGLVTAAVAAVNATTNDTACTGCRQRDSIAISSADHDFAPDSVLVTCNGPAASFDSGIPPDWTVLNNNPGNPVFWTNVAGSGESGNYTGGAGDAASASSDLQGGGSGLYDTELWSPPIDLTEASTATLNYLGSYQNFALVDFLDLDISTDGGTNWTTLLSWNEDHGTFRNTPGEAVSVDLTAYAGMSNIILRWHYYDPTGPGTSQDWYAQIDDVSLSCGSGLAIELVKTVGTDPNICAASDSLVVTPGTDVTYCYEVTNIGNVTLTLHDLVDSELGILLDDFPFSLSPLSSAFLTETITIITSTINTATWTAYNPGPTDIVSATATAMVDIVEPAPVMCNGPAAGFDSGIPPDWTVLNNTPGNPVFWTNVAGSGESGNFTGGAGDAASASSDLQGGGSGLYDTELWSPPIDLSEAITATLNYLGSYQNFALVDFLDLDISTDGGTTWTTLLSWNEDHGTFRDTPGEAVSVNLTAYAGLSNVILRWHYYDPTGPLTSQDWYAQIDDISLSCRVPAIELVKTVGTDPNTCATSQEITLPAGGGEVTYCYQVENTGTEAFALHDLVDNRLGVILDSFLFDLLPGSSVFLTQTATITGTTVNTATWSAFNPGLGSPSAQDVATARVTVEASEVYLPLIIRNMGP